MSEPRKNHLTIDGGQVQQEDNIASYKAIPESDTDFRPSKPSLSKSKERVSSGGDGAEEKLLQKEDEAKITTRVDMADAKYVVGDHRNGDAKIELDANKKFSGLTKEELLKYADDPLWVRVRWSMFVLFWALWLCMLAGAIAIIVRAPKCAPPPPKTWYEKGPLVDASSFEDLSELETELPLLSESKVAGVFTFACENTYEVLDSPGCVDKFKEFMVKAKDYGIKVIVDLTANFVPDTHKWFQLSANRTGEYADYFIWKDSTEFIGDGLARERKPPNNWVSTLNEPAWSFNSDRQEFYLHQYGAEQPDLNFRNPAVVKKFDEVIRTWMSAGAAGVRLLKARQLLVDSTLRNDTVRTGYGSDPAAVHTQYAYYKHNSTSDQPELDSLLAHWAHVVDHSGDYTGDHDSVFTLLEDSSRAELMLLSRNVSLRPAAAAPLALTPDLAPAVRRLNDVLPNWPAVQLKSSNEDESDSELAAFALLLPAAPVLALQQLERASNDTAPRESLSHLVSLREDATIQHGNYSVLAAPASNSTLQVLACARWKVGHTGYLGVYNPNSEECTADVSLVPSVPRDLTVHHVSHSVTEYTNYTSNMMVSSERVLVPPKSTVILSYVPKSTTEK